jgi:hypothetical protein
MREKGVRACGKRELFGRVGGGAEMLTRHLGRYRNLEGDASINGGACDSPHVSKNGEKGTTAKTLPSRSLY